MSAPAGFDWSWIPGTVAAATSMIVAIDVGRRAERREKATADREERRLTDEKHDRRRQLEREAALRLVKLFREARRGTIAPDEVDVAKIPVSEDDFRLVEYRRGFDDMFADWWRQAADLSVDVELITDEPTRNAIRLCVMAISRADTISRIGGWGTPERSHVMSPRPHSTSSVSGSERRGWTKARDGVWTPSEPW